jgi:hypothetical protein
MRFRLRTLLIFLALGPMVLAGAWKGWLAFHEYHYGQPAVDWSTVTVPLIIGDEEPMAGIETPTKR